MSRIPENRRIRKSENKKDVIASPAVGGMRQSLSIFRLLCRYASCDDNEWSFKKRLTNKRFFDSVITHRSGKEAETMPNASKHLLMSPRTTLDHKVPSSLGRLLAAIIADNFLSSAFRERGVGGPAPCQFRI
jgi:hypothetical protein